MSVCHICGVPWDAGFFDESGVQDAPGQGQEVVLARYDLNPQYCGMLLYFAQFTDLYARDPTQVETPGFQWQIRCNGRPRDPYLTFNRIINPWGLSGFPVYLRLEEGCVLEIAIAGWATTRAGLWQRWAGGSSAATGTTRSTGVPPTACRRPKERSKAAMDRKMRLAQLQADYLWRPAVADPVGPAETDPLGERVHELSGYILERTETPSPRGVVIAWGYVALMSSPSAEPYADTVAPVHPRLNGTHRPILQLKPVGRLVPLPAPEAEAAPPPNVRSLRPVRSGEAYRITSPPARGLVTPELAEALETVFERFAHERGLAPEKPLDVQLARGFKAGSQGHGQGRAADIAAVAGKSLAEWKHDWDRAIAADKFSDPEQRAEAIAADQKRNFGYRLYKALQAHGGWRVNEGGWRPYRRVTQLFGPWTATEGPWKTMRVKDPNPYQQQRLADQQWVFQAHQDHIHVAK